MFRATAYAIFISGRALFFLFFCVFFFYYFCFFILYRHQIFGGSVCVPHLATENENCNGTTVVSNEYTTNGLTLLNFNDVPTSLVTLLVLFVVNDW